MTMQRFRGPTRTLALLLALLAFVPLAGCRSVAQLESGDFDGAFEEEVEAGELVLLSDTSFKDFDSLDIGASFEVDVTQGDRFEIIVRVSENIADDVVVGMKDSTLHLGMKPSGMLGFRVRNPELQAVITMPELVDVDLSGASTLRFTGFDSGSAFAVDISGASTLEGALRAGDTLIDASGASNVALVGDGGNLRVDVSGASEVDLSGYAVEDAEVGASGASNIKLEASGQLDVDASGASSVRYSGEPQLGEIRTSGAGSVGER